MSATPNVSKAELLARHVNEGHGGVLDFVEKLPLDEEMSWRDAKSRPTVSGLTYVLTQVRFDDKSMAVIAKGDDGSEMIFLEDSDLASWANSGGKA